MPRTWSVCTGQVSGSLSAFLKHVCAHSSTSSRNLAAAFSSVAVSIGGATSSATGSTTCGRGGGALWRSSAYMLALVMPSGRRPFTHTASCSLTIDVGSSATTVTTTSSDPQTYTAFLVSSLLGMVASFVVGSAAAEGVKPELTAVPASLS